MRNAVIHAADCIRIKKDEIDALNVFPVPDGDTGTNMFMTISAAANEAALLGDESTASQVLECVASALLRGARGNSGVILSLIFRGFYKGVKSCESIGAKDLAAALELGSEAAYRAVMKPTEGTILTVVKKSAEAAKEKAEETDDPIEVFSSACESARAALANTPNQLPVLKKAGVVDAGGQGLVYILDAMLSVFKGEPVVLPDSKTGTAAKSESSAHEALSAAPGGESIKFAYCTEFLIEKENSQNVAELREYLESVGDCVVVVDDDSVIKVHVHTNEPGNVIQRGLDFGSFINVKIENMRRQHESTAWGAGEPRGEDFSAKSEKRYGMVAVASGEGLKEVFEELGVDVVVSGGQTMNPSTQDILQAIRQTPAEHVFVFPNNKNIIMAAEQAAPLTEKGVSVLHTKSIPEGIAAALCLEEDADAEKNHLSMMKAAEKVSTGLVTFAARDSSIGGQKIREGQIMGMENGKITVVDDDPVQAAFKVTKHLFKRGSTSLITVFCGEETNEEQARELEEKLNAKFSNEAEISVMNGNQPVYYFIISVE